MISWLPTLILLSFFLFILTSPLLFIFTYNTRAMHKRLYCALQLCHVTETNDITCLITISVDIF